MFIEICVALGALWTAAYLYFTWNQGYWKKRGIPYDEPNIFFGSVADRVFSKRHLNEIINSIYFDHPNERIVGWFNLRKPALLIRDPELAHKILVQDFNFFRNNDVDVSGEGDPMSKNIFVLKDEEWKRSRALVTPAFTSGKIKAIYPQMTQVAKEFADYLLQHPEELHVKDTMSRYTTEVITRCAFGIEGNSFKEEKPRIHQVGKSIFHVSLKSSINFMIIVLLPKIGKLLNLKIVSDEVSSFFHTILDDVIVYRQKNNVERNDLVQYLIDLKRKTEEVDKGNIKSELITRAYTDDDILSSCVTFFVEAYETTAVLITHVLYFLALNKDVQDKLRAEIDAELKKGDISFEALHEMNYLNSVILESNRLLPAGHSLFKRCSETYDLDLGNRKLTIEKGTPVTVPLYGFQTDHKYWEDAETYKPERFYNTDVLAEARSKGVFMPFGDGPRMCVGVRLSTTIAKMALVHVLSRLEVLPSSKTPKKVQFDPGYIMMSHKGGIHLKFADRSR